MNRRTTVAIAIALAAGLTLAPLAHAAGSDRFSVVVEGQGPDVILIPGLTASRHVWDGVAAHLKGHYRLHLLQLGGFAGEPVGGNASGPVSAPVAEDLARYIEANHLDHPAVIGHSMGGSIAMMLAARHPSDVGRVMVIDMAPFLGLFIGGPAATPDSLRPTAAHARAVMETSAGPEREQQISAMIATMIRTESARPAQVKEGMASDPGVGARAMEELVVTDLRPELKNITAPLVEVHVWTPQYPVSPDQLTGAYQAMFKEVRNAKVVRIDDSYHFIMIDQPEKLNAEIDAFLR